MPTEGGHSFAYARPYFFQIVKEPRDSDSSEDTASADFVRFPVDWVRVRSVLCGWRVWGLCPASSSGTWASRAGQGARPTELLLL